MDLSQSDLSCELTGEGWVRVKKLDEPQMSSDYFVLLLLLLSR
jgi:hypothetical protein